MPPLVTLSIISHNQLSMVRGLLDDLSSSVQPSALRVVLTLNTSDEEFDPDEYSRLNLVVLKNSSPKGFGANHNQAFEYCSTKWFAVVNPDIRMPRPDDTLARLIEVGQSDRRVAILAPTVFSASGAVEDSIRTNLSLFSVLFRAYGKRALTKKQLDGFLWYAGMFLLFRSECYGEIGGFDERFFLYCEDYDICARTYVTGYKVRHVSSARVIHDAQRDSHRSTRHLRWHVASLLKVWSSRTFWKIVLGNQSRE